MARGSGLKGEDKVSRGQCAASGARADWEENSQGPGGVHSPAGLAGGLWVPHVFVLAARGRLSLHLTPSLSHHFPFPAPERQGSP